MTEQQPEPAEEKIVCPSDRAFPVRRYFDAVNREVYDALKVPADVLAGAMAAQPHFRQYALQSPGTVPPFAISGPLTARPRMSERKRWNMIADPPPASESGPEDLAQFWADIRELQRVLSKSKPPEVVAAEQELRRLTDLLHGSGRLCDVLEHAPAPPPAPPPVPPQPPRPPAPPLVDDSNRSRLWDLL